MKSKQRGTRPVLAPGVVCGWALEGSRLPEGFSGFPVFPKYNSYELLPCSVLGRCCTHERLDASCSDARSCPGHSGRAQLRLQIWDGRNVGDEPAFGALRPRSTFAADLTKVPSPDA